MKILGNISEHLKKIYNRGFIINNDDEIIFDDFLDASEFITINHSWIEMVYEGDCTAWHLDGDGYIKNAFDFMLIATWKYPTEVISENIPNDYLYDCTYDLMRKEEFVKKNCEILTAEPGDVVKLNNNEFHRKNPKEYNKKHLVLRRYYSYYV